MIHFLNRATDFAKGFATSSVNVFSKRLAISLAVATGLSSVSFAAIDITIETQKGVKKISPYLYGRNIDKISDTKVESDSTEEAFISQMLEAGIHMLRANNGNNATRYNWRKKLTVHPDWFNNVYSHDWGITAKKVLDKMPGIDAMYAFQLTGYAAKTNEYNSPIGISNKLMAEIMPNGPLILQAAERSKTMAKRLSRQATTRFITSLGQPILRWESFRIGKTI